MRKRHVAALVAVCAVAGVVMAQWPEIKRYVKMKRM
jgi:cytochrome c556